MSRSTGAPAARGGRGGTDLEPRTHAPRGGASAAVRVATIALFVMIVLSLVVYAVRVATAPLSGLVTFVPDDAFYYLVLARNFVLYGRWTSDGGLTVTTGFHLLHAYVLAAMYVVFAPGSRAFAALAAGTGAAVTILALAPAVAHVRRTGRMEALWAAALLASSPNVAANAVSAMEWPLVVLVAGLYAWRLDVCGDARDAGARLFALGALGSLARSDFGLFPAALAAAAWLARGDGTARLRRQAGAGLGGAVAGLAAVLVHDAICAGHLLQASARVKYHWATFVPPGERVDAVYRLLADVLAGVRWSTARGYNAAIYVAAGVLVAAAARELLRRRARREAVAAPAFVLACGSALAVAGYAAFYSLNGEIQVWYSANFIAPLACLLAAGFAVLGPRARAGALALVAIIALRDVAVVQAHGAHTLPHQRIMLEAGEYLARHRDAMRGRAGAWNAGILGYAEGGTIVNLDGLVNDDVVAYVLDNRLAEYLVHRRIRTVVDFDGMLDPRYAGRGGYAGGALTRMLAGRRTIATDPLTGRSIGVYTVGRVAADAAPR